jgi:hypothetical protein
MSCVVDLNMIKQHTKHYFYVNTDNVCIKDKYWDSKH